MLGYFQPIAFALAIALNPALGKDVQSALNRLRKQSGRRCLIIRRPPAFHISASPTPAPPTPNNTHRRLHPSSTTPHRHPQKPSKHHTSTATMARTKQTARKCPPHHLTVAALVVARVPVAFRSVAHCDNIATPPHLLLMLTHPHRQVDWWQGPSQGPRLQGCPQVGPFDRWRQEAPPLQARHRRSP